MRTPKLTHVIKLISSKGINPATIITKGDDNKLKRTLHEIILVKGKDFPEIEYQKDGEVFLPNTKRTNIVMWDEAEAGEVLDTLNKGAVEKDHHYVMASYEVDVH